MIKFIIISRHKPGMTRERFFYEWAYIHVALMVQTASSMRRFTRYVQHYANPDIGDEHRLLPHPPQDWESYADHGLARFEAYGPAPDYLAIMRPHSFSDSAMEIVYLEGRTEYRRDDFRPDGVKLIHRLARRPGMTPDEFRRHWRDDHVPRLVEALRTRGLRKYDTCLPHEIDLDALRASRKGTLFDSAEVNTADGVEELWFDTLEDAMRLGSDPALRQSLSASYASFTDIGQSYSMFAQERVVFDFVTPGETTPRPAVLDDNSLEARLFKSGRPFHEPRPVEPS
ncbi:MAG: EthD domain-containing protein [Burkholderiales bacterium]|nr:EthD domain-containing protein [Burkholderiales bacterium]